MGKILKKYYCGISIGIFVLFMIHGCNETECSESKTTILWANFYNSDLSMHSDTLAVYGLNINSMLIDTSVMKNISLPLKLTESSTSFVFDFFSKNDELRAKDTILFIHKNSEHFISEACGCVMFFSIDTIIHTKHKIDSIAIRNKNITNEEQENIQIFL